MALSWSAWILVICAALAFLCVVYGAIRAALAARVVKQHTDALKSLQIVNDVAEAQAYAARINAAMDGMPALIARADGAVQRIGQSLHELRMPEAFAAIRLAGASLRLLFGRFPTPR